MSPLPTTLRRRAGGIALVAALGLSVSAPTPSEATTSSLTIDLFQDLDRDGVRDAGESGWAERVLYVMTPAGSFVKGAVTDASGRATVTGLATSTYEVRLSDSDWGGLARDWTPTTTGSYLPRKTVDLSKTTSAPLGLRPVSWSTTLGSPIDSAVGASGVTVEVYNDAVSAASVVALLESGTAIGAEAPGTRIRLGFEDRSYTVSGSSGSPGTYSNFSATVYLDWTGWLNRGEHLLFHEYGHAWSQYRRRIVNQWSDFAPYLQARGIDPADPRLGTSHAWQPGELIAEDFRQLFGAPSARSGQENTELPLAADVPGLATWLSGTFSTGSGGSSGGGDTGSGGSGSGSGDSGSGGDPTVALAITGLTAGSPAADATSIAFEVSRTARVRVVVTDASGKGVRQLMDGSASGAVALTWDLTDDRGRRVKDGRYEVVVTATADGAAVSSSVPVDVDRKATTGGDTGGDTGGSTGGKGGGKGRNA